MERILSTECEILLRLASPINKVVSNILHLVIRALQGLVEVRERERGRRDKGKKETLYNFFYNPQKRSLQYYGLNCILCFCSVSVSRDHHVPVM